MRVDFEKMVQDLDDAALVDLHDSVAAEAEQRRRKVAFQFEHIRTGMSADEKAQAAFEIARALRER